MPYEEFSDEAAAFLQVVEDDGWIVPFDWAAWSETPAGQTLLSDPDAVSHATADDLAKILTSLSRKERFSGGTWTYAFETGLLAAIARRAGDLSKDS